MSFDYNYKFWVVTSQDIDNVAKRQEVLKALDPVDEKEEQHRIFAELYAQYVDLVNKLGYVYNVTFQVQKREIIKELVEAATQRVLELKEELKNLEFSEFVYIDKTLIQRKLTPTDIEIWRPKYFPFIRPQAIEDLIRCDSLTFDLAKANENIPVGEVSKEDTQKLPLPVIEEKLYEIKLKKAILIIQSHERARKMRLWLSYIRLDPGTYKPTRSLEVESFVYKFTHKSDQVMKIPIKRTEFESDFLRHHADVSGFNFYVKPEREVRQSKDSQRRSSRLDSRRNTIQKDHKLSSLFKEVEEEEEEGEDDEQVTEEKLRNQAAIKIQSAMRGFWGRRIFARRLQKKYQVYGMIPSKPSPSQSHWSHTRFVQEARQHHNLVQKLDEDFRKLYEDERTRILQVRGPWIMEDISDHIRAWFKEFYDAAGSLYPYPEAVKGGTILLLTGETPTAQEYAAEMAGPKKSKEDQKKEAEKKKAEREKEKAKEKKQKKKEAEKRKKLKKAGIIDIAYNLTSNKNLIKIEETMKKYREEWKFIDEHLNREHAAIVDWVTAEQLSEIHKELRVTVDSFMRLEHELLERALAKDKKTKYTPPKEKPVKPPKEKKLKKKADMTGDRSIESLYEELKEAGIIRHYEKKTLENFIGERNNIAYHLRNIELVDSIPGKGEITDVIREYVLGMGSLVISKPMSVCLVGPANSGKKLLCYMLATEADAVLMDLSPEVTYKYIDNIKYLINVVTKMAKELQPTVILFNGVHRLFWKKVPKDEEFVNAKLLAAFLTPKIFKALKSEKVIFLGTSDMPWGASPKLKKAFEKILLVPRTDYGTGFLLWLSSIFESNEIPRSFDVSALSLVMKKYTTGDIIANIHETLKLPRRMRLLRQPLNPMEFLDTFLERGDEPPLFPPEDEEWEKFTKWFTKANKLAGQREALLASLPKPKK